MSDNSIDRLPLYVAAAGVVLTLTVAAIGGLDPAIGALAGAIVATLNFVGFKWLVRRMVGGTPTGQRSAAFMLAGKMALVMVVCWVLLARLEIHAVGFAVGMSALFLGFGLGGASLAAAADASDEQTPATEEG